MLILLGMYVEHVNDTYATNTTIIEHGPVLYVQSFYVQYVDVVYQLDTVLTVVDMYVTVVLSMLMVFVKYAISALLKTLRFVIK